MAEAFEAMSREQLLREVLGLREQLARRSTRLDPDEPYEQLRCEHEHLLEAQHSMQAAVAHYRTLFEESPVAAVILDSQGHITEMSGAARELLGLHGPLLGRSLMQCVHDRDHRALAHHLRDALDTEGWAAAELLVRRPGGSTLPVRIITSHDRHDGGFRVVLFDVSEARRAKEAVSESESRFRQMAEASPVLVWMSDAAGRLVYANRRWTDYTGLGARELLEHGFAFAVHPDDLPRCDAAFTDAQRRRAEFQTQVRLRARDGSYEWFLVTAAPRCRSTAAGAEAGGPDGASPRAFPDPDLLGYIGSSVNIGDVVRAREQLARHNERLEAMVRERTAELERSHERLRLTERMASIGTLAAGLGHDMGNLLLPIRARLEVMQAKGLPSDVQLDLEAVRQCTDYLQALSSGLRLFALDPTNSDCGCDAATDLTAWWRQVGSLMRSAVPAGVLVEANGFEGLPPVRLGPHQLTQAIVNLVNNSGQALSERGRGTVRISAEAVNGRSGAGSASVRLSVADDGPGMAPEVAQHAIEPFFTTRTRRISTGLGLSIVHSIVTNAGGAVDIHSTPPEGTTVSLTIPVAGTDGQTADGQSQRPRMAVSVEDRRLAAIVSAVATGLGAEVRSLARHDPGDSTLWVVDASPDLLAPVRTFMAGRHDRQVLVLGDVPADWRTLPVATVPPDCPMSRLREAIRSMALHPAQ